MIDDGLWHLLSLVHILKIRQRELSGTTDVSPVALDWRLFHEIDLTLDYQTILGAAFAKK